MRTITHCLLALACFFFTYAPMSKSAEAGPLAVLKKTQKKIVTILERDIKKGDKAAKKKQEKDLKAIVQPFIDFEFLGRTALAKHWKTLKPQQQKRFLYWLKALMEMAYVRSLHKGLQGKKKEVRIKYLREKIDKKKNRATVFTKIRVKNKRGRWGKVRIDWTFYKKKKEWLVMDVTTNDNSLVETYEEQFDKIIKKKSFADLVRRLKNKTQELRKQEGLSPMPAFKGGAKKGEAKPKKAVKSAKKKCKKGRKLFCYRPCLKRKKRRCVKRSKKKKCYCRKKK